MTKNKISNCIKIIIIFLICGKIASADARDDLTEDQKKVYDAIKKDVSKEIKNSILGDIKINGSVLSFPKSPTDGNVNGVTELDGEKHILKLGLLHLDGYRGNIYMPGSFGQNEVGTNRTWYTGGIAGSNIALGSGNMAGKQLEAITKKVTIDDSEKDIIVDYKRKRNVTNYRIPLWNIKPSGEDRTYSTAIGFINAAYGVGAFAIGQYSVAGEEATFAGGWGSMATNKQAFAFGKKVKAMGEQSVAFGNESEAWGENSFAVGKQAKAKNKNAIAMGYSASASGKSSFAVGAESIAEKFGSVAIGYYAKSHSEGAFAIGQEAEAIGKYSLAAGSGVSAKGNVSTAIGYGSLSNAYKSMALAGGKVDEEAEFGISVGDGAVTKTKNGLSLGGNSLANRKSDVYGYSILSDKIFDEDSLLHYLGKDKAEKVLEYNKNIRDNMGKYEKAREELSKAKQALDDMYHGRPGALEYTSENARKLEKEISEKEKIFNEIDNYIKERINGRNKIIGAYFSTESAISIGNEDTGMTRQLTGVSAGTQDTDAVNVAQLKELKNYVDNSNPFEYSKKDGTKVYKDANGYYILKDGKREDITDTKDLIIRAKGNLQLSNVKSSIIEEKTSQSQPPKPTPKPNDNETNKPNKEGEDKKFPNDIPKEKNEHVVVVQDLKLLKKDVDSQITKLKDEKADKSELSTLKKEVTTNTKSINIINKDIVNIKNDIKKIDEKSELALGGVSNAIAIANLPQVSGNKKFNLSAAYGYYGTSHSLAIGISGQNNSGNFIYKLSGSVNNHGNLALGLGIGVMLGEKENEYPNKTAEVEKLMEKVSNLEKSNEELRKENREIKEMINKLLKK